MNPNNIVNLNPIGYNPVFHKAYGYFRQFDYYTNGKERDRIIQNFFTNPHSPYPYHFDRLNREIVKANSDLFQPKEHQLKKIWQVFCNAVRSHNSQECESAMGAFLSQFSNDSILEEFWDTDLVIYPDYTPDNFLPPNGMRHSDFIEVKELYRNLITRPACFNIEIKGSDAFKSCVHRDIRWLVSREESRNLLFKGLKDLTLNRQHSLVIEQGNEDSAAVYPPLLVQHKITLSYKALPLTQEMGDGQIRLFMCPPFATFGHEWAHFRDYMNQNFHLENGRLDPLLSTRLEQRAIEGLCVCHPPTNECENAIHRAHGLFPRKDHRSKDNILPGVVDQTLRNLIAQPSSSEADTSVEEILKRAVRGDYQHTGLLEGLNDNLFTTTMNELPLTPLERVARSRKMMQQP